METRLLRALTFNKQAFTSAWPLVWFVCVWIKLTTSCGFYTVTAWSKDPVS